MRKLKALFAAEPSHIRAICVGMMDRTGDKLASVRIYGTDIPGDTHHCWVDGKAQEVMFIIGECANHGEDFLQSVREV